MSTKKHCSDTSGGVHRVLLEIGLPFDGGSVSASSCGDHCRVISKPANIHTQDKWLARVRRLNCSLDSFGCIQVGDKRVCVDAREYPSNAHTNEIGILSIPVLN